VVRCSECGFIAARLIQTRGFIEVDDEKRDSGELESKYGVNIEPIPICFVNGFNIKGEVEALGKGSAEWTRDSIKEWIPPVWASYVKQVLNRERVCESFMKWQQGFTPKEHREMMDRERRDRLEAEIRKNDRKWHWIELAAIILGTGLFTLLGAWIATGY
jgi:hypothetical protein